jgi:hypothetical protein
VVAAPTRRQLGFAFVAAGFVLAVVFLAMPRVHGYEVHCEPEPTGERVAGGGWWAVRGSQQQTPAVYNETNDTTLIVPGCGHGDAGLALRVKGNVSWFDGEHDRLILSGRGVTGATTMLSAPPADDGQDQPEPLQLMEGTFEVRSLWGHTLAAAGAPLALSSGLGLLRLSSRLAPFSLPAGALVGIVLAHAVWRTDLGLFIFILFLPILGIIPGIGSVVGTVATWKGRRAFLVFATILAYAVAFWVTFIAFGGAYPLSPDA